MALWVSAVIINLHLHTVWNSKFLVNKYVALNIICWGGPLVVTVISFVYHQVQFEFANLCLLSADWIYKLFFDPLAAIVLPSVVIHLATFFHIARVRIFKVP
jgi:multisubunit Na+/H+ antiporter MnhC subunit